MICTNCLRTDHRASKCPYRTRIEPHVGVHPDVRSVEHGLEPNIDLQNKSMLHNICDPQVDVMKRGR